MIFALFLIAGIHAAVLKTYEQAKYFFNTANAQSSFGESSEEKRHTFIGVCSLPLIAICKYLIYVIDNMGVFANLSEI